MMNHVMATINQLIKMDKCIDKFEVKRLQLLLIVPTFKNILRSTQELTLMVCFLKPSFKVFDLGLNLHLAMAGAPHSLQLSPRLHGQVQPPSSLERERALMSDHGTESPWAPATLSFTIF